MRVAIIHDWLTEPGGAEKVLGHLLALYPEADLFALVDFFPDDARQELLAGRRAKVSFIQNLPFAKRAYRNYLPLMPVAIEQFDLSDYQLIISSSYAVAKGVITGPDQVHVSYVHSPIRYAWDMQHQYLRESNLETGFKSMMARAVLHYIRIWDVRTAHGIDQIAVNSKFVGRRVRKAYGRRAEVVYPPVDITKFELRVDKEQFYLTASRMVPYKRMQLIVEAFNSMPDKQLVVIGDGPEFDRIKAVAKSNIKLLGYQSFDSLRDHMQRAKGFVFAAEEDFGIAPVEAQACGTPVIAYGKGGALETVVGFPSDKPTGLFFLEQSVESIRSAVHEFESVYDRFNPLEVRAHAEKFSADAFKTHFKDLVERAKARLWSD